MSFAQIIKKILAIPARAPELDKQKIIEYGARIPKNLELAIMESQDGGYIIEIKNMPGCLSQTDHARDIFTSMNDALYTYLEIPETYAEYFGPFLPSKEILAQCAESMPEMYIRGGLVIQTTYA
jgi:predicted RNase H-like HicB family nuclease